MIFIKAFVCGGIICAIAQLLIDKTKLTPARILVSYVVAGVILSAIGVYEPFSKFAGAGASVPIIGFGHVLAEGVRTTIQEKGALGILTGGLIGASAGISAVIFFSLIMAVVFKSKRK